MFFFLLALLVAGACAAPLDSDKDAPVLRFDSDVGPDKFSYAYETGNGISAQNSGELKNFGPDGQALTQIGSFQYTDPEGKKISVNYVADENGYRPEGVHFPTPPPTPEAIARAIAYVAAHPPSETSNKIQVPGSSKRFA